MKDNNIDMGAYNLHLIKTKNFKTITIEVNFRRLVDDKEITKRNLLKMLLLDSTKDFPREKDLIKETENLYDLKLYSYINRIGNYSNLSFKVRFLNDKYTSAGFNKKSILFFLSIIFNPNIKNNAFDKELLNINKEKLKKIILLEKDNKIKYSLRNLLSMVKDKPYSYNPYGDIKDLNLIDEKNLYEYYKSILSEELIDVFVVGDFDEEEIKSIFRDCFKVSTYKKKKNDVLINELPISKTIARKVISDSANQTIFTLLCGLHKLTDFERKYVIKVYNEILGGSANSLLFTSVREKNSYCYFINSIVKPYDNVLMIYSGIEKENIDNVLNLVLKTMNEMVKGNISNSLLYNAKETIISNLNTIEDSPNSIINNYYSTVLFENANIKDRIDNFKKVTLKDIIDLAKKITPNSMFVLKGDINEKDCD